jgi:PDZ domain
MLRLGGRVIVQNINSLSDGRASPAQLTGVIQRGDVLSAIDGKSIVNLPLDQLVIGLQPLSTPMEDGTYKRILRLRFAAGDGLSALDSNDKLLSKAPTESGVFNLTQFLPQDFPIVDNLSGQPLFGDSLIATAPVKSPIKEEPASNSNALNSTNIVNANELVSNPQFVGIKRSLSYHEHISLEISQSFQKEKSCLISEYFAWSDNYSELLRPPQRTSMLARDVVIDYWRKMKNRLEQGQNVINGAKALMDTLEDIDKGKDVRSFQVWSSNVSLRSRATTRRRYVLDTASLMASTIAEELDSDAGVSVGSDELDDLDGIDGDELLVQLAAHDEIWRKQVLETIAKATKEMEDDESEKENCNSNDLDIAEKLGNLLLGEQVNKLLMKKKKSFALPQDDVTCVLFDLVSYLASTTPDEISMKGKFEVNPQTRLVPFQKSRGSSSNNDPILAAIFVVNEVFPAWLACFKPLPWEERRVLWPQTKATSNSNIGVESVADDLLTVDSSGTSPIPNRKKKNLRETIEDMELDVESRAETCFLITFYFTQEILPGMVGDRGISRVVKAAWTETQALDFLDKFGSYLRLPMSIAYAAFLESKTILEKLLELAKHDPRHLEAMKEVSKTDSLLLYETVSILSHMTVPVAFLD